MTLARLASLLFLAAALLAATGIAEASRWLGAGPAAATAHGEIICAVGQADAPARLPQHGMVKASRSSRVRLAPAGDRALSPIVRGETPSRQATMHSDYRSCHSPPCPLPGAGVPGPQTAAGDAGGKDPRIFQARTAPLPKPSKAGRASRARG